MNKDTVIGIVGATLLVAAMVVVFVYERNNVQATDGTAAVATHVGPALSGSVARGASDSKTEHVAASGPMNVTFHLTWTATNGKDTLKITVTPPAGSTGLMGGSSQASDSGDISLKVDIPNGSTSNGNWTVKVEFTAATPAPLPGGVPPPPGAGMTDASVSYKVAVTAA